MKFQEWFEVHSVQRRTPNNAVKVHLNWTFCVTCVCSLSGSRRRETSRCCCSPSRVVWGPTTRGSTHLKREPWSQISTGWAGEWGFFFLNNYPWDCSLDSLINHVAYKISCFVQPSVQNPKRHSLLSHYTKQQNLTIYEMEAGNVWHFNF